MKRKLIDQNTFEKITNESTSANEQELVLAEEMLARTLNKEAVRLHCFTENQAVYETLDGTYINTNYDFDNKSINFSNIEELVIDEESKEQKMREHVAKFIDALCVEQDENKARACLKDYVKLHEWSKKKKVVKDKDDNLKVAEVEENPDKAKKGKHKKLTFKEKAEKKAKKTKKGNIPEGLKAYLDKKKKDFASQHGVKEESYRHLSESVLQYVDFMENGPDIMNSNITTDPNGNPVAVSVPNSRTRNEHKLLSFNWKTLNHEVKILREQAFNMPNNQDFCKTVVELKRQNNLSNNSGLEEALDVMVNKFPTVIYLTQTELAQTLAEALSNFGTTNYDDKTVDFMAEAVLRRAYEAYSEKVDRISALAGNPINSYEDFQSVAETFYPNVDNQFQVEKKVFKDLYEAMTSIYQTADRRGNDRLKYHVGGYLNELANVLNGEIDPSLELAQEVATWIDQYVETNLEMQNWDVKNTPHITVSGDHPDMAKKANHPYTPSKDFSGDWGDTVTALNDEGGSYRPGGAKQMRNSSWGNIGGDGVYPTLDNPYVPKAGEFTMPNDKGVDKDWGNGHGSWQSGDTWPNLENPYLPKSMVPKMNHTSSDLVVNQ